MQAPDLQPLGPPPFRFTPSGAGGVLRARAYPRFFQLLATALVAGTGAWMYMLWESGKLAASGGLSGFAWPVAAFSVMAYTWWHIQKSVTTLTPEGLHQTWMWDKKMELRELAYGKLVRVRGLDWLIAPRLYVRTLLGKFAVFYAADPVMLGEFERLVRELGAFRGFR